MFKNKYIGYFFGLANPVVTQNNLFNNTKFDIKNLDSTTKIDASSNYFGGKAPKTSGNVLVENPLTKPVDICTTYAESSNKCFLSHFAKIEKATAAAV